MLDVDIGHWVICVYKWYLPTLSEIITLTEPDQSRLVGFPAQHQVRAEREWTGAVAALNQLLHQWGNAEQQTIPACAVHAASVRSIPIQPDSPFQGVVFSGPFPVLNQIDLAGQFASWMFTVATPGETLQLLPAAASDKSSRYASIPTLPLLPSDPLAAEQFCLVLTAQFSLVMVLGETPEATPAFFFSFDPEVVQQAWRSLEARIKLSAPHLLPAVARLVDHFAPIETNYRIVTQFSRAMLSHLPQPLELEQKRPAYPGNGRVFEEAGKSLVAFHSVPVHPPVEKKLQSVAAKVHSNGAKAVGVAQEQVSEAAVTEPTSDTELLQAIAHEVRTPLTTIRTLTRLLLRRKDLIPDVRKRLEVIDRECTEQIDRFSLIFRAVELETAQCNPLFTSLSPISLDQVIKQNMSRWQQQASQHSHTLEVILPQKMPLVVTDPTMLDQVLTGLIDRITHTLPPGSHIQVRVSLAGHQLKLQLESQPQDPRQAEADKARFGFAPALKSLGQLLSFQPETGNLSLNMAVTKNLFQALGGKLIVRQHPQQGEVLTIFLPLDTKKES